MSYRVFIERRAEKDLEKLPKDIKRRVSRAILKLKDKPRPAKVRKIKSSDNYYRARIGDWRIVYEINDAEERINIFRIRHRKEAYFNL